MVEASTPTHLHQRDGTSQRQRLSPALDPAFTRVDERSATDLFAFACQLAQHIKYYNGQNEPEGTWQDFFNADQIALISRVTEQLNQPASTTELTEQVPPHLALFVTFLNLFGIAQEHLNTLTGRHLDFYYKDILRFRKAEPVGDAVHVLFELGKNVPQQLLTKGTRLDAGKDGTGKKLQYILQEDVILNQAKITQLRSVFRDPFDQQRVHYALQANSADGLGESLSEQSMWKPFGDAGLPTAEIGFSVASPILLLREGRRVITLTLVLQDNAFTQPAPDQWQNALIAYLSGEKEWLGPFSVTPSISLLPNGQLQLTVVVELPPNEEAVSFYDQSALSGGFNTLSPLLKLVTNPKAASTSYQSLKEAVLVKARIAVRVESMKDVAIENDQGRLDPGKPFMPFGTAPGIGSAFYIGSDEALLKNLTAFTLHIHWQDLPNQNLATHYRAYTRTNVSGNDYNPNSTDQIIRKNTDFTVDVQLLKGGNWETVQSQAPLFKPVVSGDDQAVDTIDLAVTTQQRVTGSYKNLLSRVTTGMRNVRDNASPARPTKLILDLAQIGSKPQFNRLQKQGFLRLVLRQDFLHRYYPNLYAATLIEKNKPDAQLLTLLANPNLQDLVSGLSNSTKVQTSAREDNTLQMASSTAPQVSAVTNPVLTAGQALPKEPYTPIIKSFVLDYTAATGNVPFDTAAQQDYDEKEIQFFNVGAFGQMEEHGYLKNKVNPGLDGRVYLFPQYRNEGEFYIGLQDIKPLQSVQILFQVAEGSANPEKPRQTVEWRVLCQNEWKLLDRTYLLSDTTNQLLTSGVIRFYIPKEATDDNTLLDSGFYWLSASVRNYADAVSQLIGVYPQAVKAVFIDQDNETSHLKTALPTGTITKLASSIPGIRKVSQPFPSFGGQMREADNTFNSRVSERLRHKQRAITIWDYEHLVLQHFPDVYKVKCISHADAASFLAPGQVTLITVPDLTNRNAVDRLQPRVSLNTLSAISDYLKTRNSLFVSVNVENPVYEQILLDFKVKFHQNFEFGYYSQVLNEAIVRHLSPWAYETGVDILFGGRMHKSVLLYFLEQLDYVDYITDFKLFKIGRNQTADLDELVASTAKAVLVSSPVHRINPVATP